MDNPRQDSLISSDLRNLIYKLQTTETEIDVFVSNEVSRLQKPKSPAASNWMGRAVSVYEEAKFLLNQQTTLLSFEWTLSSHRSVIKDYLKKNIITQSQLTLLQSEVNRVHNKVNKLRELISPHRSEESKDSAEVNKRELEDLSPFEKAIAPSPSLNSISSAINESILTSRFFNEELNKYVADLINKFRKEDTFDSSYFPHLIKAVWDINRCSELTQKEKNEILIKLSTLFFHYYLTENRRLDPNQSVFSLGFKTGTQTTQKMSLSVLSKLETARVNNHFMEFVKNSNYDIENPKVKDFIQYMTNTTNRGGLDHKIHLEEQDAVDKEFEDLFTAVKLESTQQAEEKKSS